MRKEPQGGGLAKMEPVVVSLELYLCELHSGRVPKDRAVWHVVASVADELVVPHTEIVLPVRPLREHGDGRPARTGNTLTNTPHCSH